MIINGKKIAEDIIQKLKTYPPTKKYLAVFLVGDDLSSLNFIAQKEKLAKILKIDFRLYRYPQNITQDFLRKAIHQIGDKKNCGGVIVQLPLPKHINPEYVLNAIPREKDIDVLGERALGSFYTGRSLVIPPACGVVEEIFNFTNFQIAEKKVAIVGVGRLVGKPILVWLLGKTKEIFVFNAGSDLSLISSSDLVICGVGKAHLISPSMLKKKALVIDFGYDTDGKKIFGDFQVDEKLIQELEISYTPTPSGTGPILVAKVFENFLKLNLEKK